MLSRSTSLFCQLRHTYCWRWLTVAMHMVAYSRLTIRISHTHIHHQGKLVACLRGWEKKKAG